jgi:predicted solute-binding protein
LLSADVPMTLGLNARNIEKRQMLSMRKQSLVKKMETAKRQEDEVIPKTEEFSRKKEEAKQRAVQLEQETERIKQMRLAVQNFVEDLSRLSILAYNKYIWFPKNLLTPLKALCQMFKSKEDLQKYRPNKAGTRVL